jgi:tRNA1(Val) A37 N6-methylase TrmN6
MILVEGVKAAGKEAKILPPLILYDNKGEYTEEVKAIFERI